METRSEPPPVALFKRVFTRLTPETVMPLAEPYAPDVVFEDPLHRIERLDALNAYFAKLNARIESAELALATQVVARGVTARLPIAVPIPIALALAPGNRRQLEKPA